MMPMRCAIKGLRHDEIRRLKREDTDTPLCQDDNRAVALLRIIHQQDGASESDLGLGPRPLRGVLKEFGST